MAVPWDSRCLVRITWEGRVILTRMQAQPQRMYVATNGLESVKLPLLTSFAGKAWVDLSSYDILRWDSRELIAVDSSPICIVNTLRADFTKKKVTMSSTLTGEKGMPMPNGNAITLCGGKASTF